MTRVIDNNLLNDFLTANLRAVTSELDMLLESIELKDLPEDHDMDSQLGLIESKLNITRKILKKNIP